MSVVNFYQFGPFFIDLRFIHEKMSPISFVLFLSWKSIYVNKSQTIGQYINYWLIIYNSTPFTIYGRALNTENGCNLLHSGKFVPFVSFLSFPELRKKWKLEGKSFFWKSKHVGLRKSCWWWRNKCLRFSGRMVKICKKIKH